MLRIWDVVCPLYGKYCYLHTMDELQALCMLSHLILTPCEVVTISICIIQMGKLRLREFR